MNILVDTNIALYLFGGDEQVSGVLDGQVVHASFVTELELLGYPGIAIEEEKLIRHFLDDCVVIDLNGQIKSKTIQLRRQYGLKLPDSIIAATACYLGIPLFSADMDFRAVKEIDLMVYERS
jgi:predicted nucleic acid-binding protein